MGEGEGSVVYQGIRRGFSGAFFVVLLFGGSGVRGYSRMPFPLSPKALKPQAEKQPCILRLRRPSWPTSGRAERPEADRLHSMTGRFRV